MLEERLELLKGLFLQACSWLNCTSGTVLTEWLRVVTSTSLRLSRANDPVAVSASSSTVCCPGARVI